MFPMSAASSQTIKVSFGDDTRRLTIRLAAGTSSASAFAAIQRAVKQTFRLSDASNLVLKYLDDEGDLCTLAELCVEDLATLAEGRPWKIQASLGAQPTAVAAASVAAKPSTLAAYGAEGSPAAEPAVGAASRSRAESIGSCPSTESDLADDDEGGMPPEWKEISTAMAFHVLPCVAKAAQLEVVRSALSTAGVERRKRVVKWCCEVLEHLDLVPEAAPLRPKLEAFVDGSDPQRFGDVLAELLKVWTSSSSPELVKDVVAMHHKGFEAIMKQTFKALHKCKGEWKGKGKGKCGWWMGKGGAGKGGCDWWTGKACKGESEGEREGSASKGDWLTSKGERWMAKAMGKGKYGKRPEEWAQHLQGMLPLLPLCGLGDPAGLNPFLAGDSAGGAWSSCDPLAIKGALAGLLAQKGLGKGIGCWPSWPSNTASEDEPAHAPAAAAAPGAACVAEGAAAPLSSLPAEPLPVSLPAAMDGDAEDSAHATATPAFSAPFGGTCEAARGVAPQAAAPGEGDLSREVQLLLEMGLVNDPGVGLDLLRAQGGDISQVAAMCLAERFD